MKTCNKCGIEKPIDDFYKNKNVKSGYFNQCKRCHNGRGMAWTKMTTEERREKDAELQAYAEAYCKRHPNAFKCLIEYLRDGLMQNRPSNWDNVASCV